MGLRPLVWSVLLIVPGRRFGDAFERAALSWQAAGLLRVLKTGAKRKLRCGGGPAVRGGAGELRGAKRRNLDLRTLNYGTTKRISLLSRFASLVAQWHMRSGSRSCRFG